MSLARSYRKMFSMEAGVMSVWILGSLKRLEQNPQDAAEIRNLKECADVVVGDAKFLGNKELEAHARLLLSLLNGEKLTEQKSKEISELIEQFRKFAK